MAASLVPSLLTAKITLPQNRVETLIGFQADFEISDNIIIKKIKHILKNVTHTHKLQFVVNFSYHFNFLPCFVIKSIRSIYTLNIITDVNL